MRWDSSAFMTKYFVDPRVRLMQFICPDLLWIWFSTSCLEISYIHPATFNTRVSSSTNNWSFEHEKIGENVEMQNQSQTTNNFSRKLDFFPLGITCVNKRHEMFMAILRVSYQPNKYQTFPWPSLQKPPEQTSSVPHVPWIQCIPQKRNHFVWKPHRQQTQTFCPQFQRFILIE